MKRLILAAAALTTLAMPAHAQRLDTRRVDIKTQGDRTTCGFNAYPGLSLIETPTSKVATLGLAATEPGGPAITLMFSQGQDWRHPSALGIIVRGQGDAALPSQSIYSGRLRVDGKAAADLFATNGDGGPSYDLISDMTVGPTVFAMIDHSTRADLDLLGAKGAVLRSYSWDTRRVSDAVETVSVVGWSCTSS